MNNFWSIKYKYGDEGYVCEFPSKIGKVKIITIHPGGCHSYALE